MGNPLEISRCEGKNQIEKNQTSILVVHGGWSPWSSWSHCPQLCGKSFRFRTRTCTNPSPRNHGRLCIGSEREEEPCPERICSNGRTSNLTLIFIDRMNLEWTLCSKSCGSGIQKRICLTKECLEETRLCNEFPCPSELRKELMERERMVLFS